MSARVSGATISQSNHTQPTVDRQVQGTTENGMRYAAEGPQIQRTHDGGAIYNA